MYKRKRIPNPKYKSTLNTFCQDCYNQYKFYLIKFIVPIKLITFVKIIDAIKKIKVNNLPHLVDHQNYVFTLV